MITIIKWIKNPTVQRILLLICVFVLAIFLFKGCGRSATDDKITRLEQNICAYKDSLTTSKNKEGELQYNMGLLAATNDDLSLLSDELADEVEKQKGKVIYLSKINAELHDSITEISNKSKGSSVTVKANADGTQDIDWSYEVHYDEFNSRQMEGKARIGFHDDSVIVKTTITDIGDSIRIEIPVIDEDNVVICIPKDIIRMSFSTGLEEAEDGKMKIYLKSDYPGFTPTKIEGALIDPQESELIKSYFPRKRFVVGPMIGGGLTSDIKLSIFIGVGVTYKIFEF